MYVADSCSLRNFAATILALLASVTITSDAKKSSSGALTRKLLQRGYEKLVPAQEPTTVKLGIYINYFYEITEQTMDYSIGFYLRQEWFDSRLMFNRSDNGNNSKITLDREDIKRLWIPSVFLANEKGAYFHMVTTPNNFATLEDNGRLWYVNKITAKLACPMRLEKYPLDTQRCPIIFKSFGYPMTTIQYDWLQPVAKAVEFDSTGKLLPEMEIGDHTLHNCSAYDATANPPGMYPCLEVKFIVKRHLGYFIIQFYFPSVLLVTMSWVSFWISSDAVVARVSIGLLTILNLVTQSTGSQKQLPKVSYVKAIDVWMTTCLVFAFASLIEFATVNVWSRTDARRTKPPGGGSSATPAPPQIITLPDRTSADCCGAGPTPCSKRFGRGRGPVRDRPRGIAPLAAIASPAVASAAASGLSPHQQRAKMLDRYSRVVFPGLFLLFNAIYWTAYGL